MNLKQALLHNTGWRILAMLFTFINNILIVRLLGAAGGASLFYAIAVFTLISTVLRFGIENSIVYYASKYPGQTKPLISFVAVLTALQLLISFAVLKSFISEAVPYSIFWVVIFTTGSATMYYITAFYQVQKRYISINVLNLLVTFLQTCLLLYFYFGSDNFMLRFGLAKNINDAVLVMISAATLLQIIILSVWLVRGDHTSFQKVIDSKPNIKGLFKYAGINFLCTVIFYLVTRADFYFVEKYCDPLSLGNYVQVAKIGQMALVIPGLLGGVIFPFSVNAESAFTDKITFFCRVMTLVFLICFAGLILFGGRLFTWMLGADFYLVSKGIIAAFPGIYFLAMSLIFTSFFEGKNRQKIILAANFITLGVLIAGDLIFVPAYGYMAAAIVFSVANFAGMMVLLIRFLSSCNRQISDVFFLKNYDLKFLKLRK